MNLTTMKTCISIAALGAALSATSTAGAADNRPAAAQGTTATQDGTPYSDRAKMKAWSTDKDQLQREMPLGQSKDFYVKALADRGFHITSINVDRPGAAEYEVVKGQETFEVQLDFDGAGKATKVDVTTNAWRSDATSAAMKGSKVPVATRAEPGNERYSDRARMKSWTDEKDKLEKSLALGRDKGYYLQQLKSMGYQVTAVNDSQMDYAEYEIVRGTNSFEVQIDFAGGKGKEVDVTTNAWKADATERALAGRR